MLSFFDLQEQQLYEKSVKLLTDFFKSKGYKEVHMQSRLSILAACEDPTTIASFNYNGSLWPLPQTNQMNLEIALLSNKEYIDNHNIPGIFCTTTSYRQEANPIEGRHDYIFPMFEFEAKGNISDLQDLLIELLIYADIDRHDIKHLTYEQLAKLFNVTELTHVEEERIDKEISHATFIKYFPEYTSPFWNMKRSPTNPNLSHKIDTILHGIETIGSAEREVDPKVMKDRFYNISNGQYAETLFAHFGKERVKQELDEFLNLPFFPRFGGGIGLTRFMRIFKF